MSNKQAIFWIAVTWLLLSYGVALWQFPDVAHLGMSALFGLAIWDLYSRRLFHESLRFHQPESFLGGTVVVLLGILNLRLHSFYLLRVTPFIGGVAVILLAFGVAGCKTYRRELGLLFFLGLPSAIAPLLPDPSPLAAQFGGGLLTLAGVDVSFTEGTNLVLSSGAVEVFRGCSGLEYMTYLLGLAVLCLTVFPLRGPMRYWVPLFGVLLGFGVNGFRVALLAILVSRNDIAGFDYWHGGPGSLLFGAVAVILFGLFYGVLLQARQKENSPGKARGKTAL